MELLDEVLEVAEEDAVEVEAKEDLAISPSGTMTCPLERRSATTVASASSVEALITLQEIATRVELARKTPRAECWTLDGYSAKARSEDCEECHKSPPTRWS